MENYFIPVIIGTSRPERMSIHVANLIHEIANQRDDIESVLVDPVELDLKLDGNADNLKNQNYSDITQKADGFFIVVPEYNRAYPGSLKRLLDSEYQNYKYKAVALAGVSSGIFGGTRAIQALVPVLREFNMFPIRNDLFFPKVQDLFDKNGNLTDKSFIERINKVYDELVWLAKTLKWGRGNP